MPLGKTFSLASGIDIGLFGKQSSPQLAPAGGGMGQPVEIHSHINIDGREVGIAVNRYNRFNKRSS